MQDHRVSRFSLCRRRRIVLIVTKALSSYGRCMSIRWPFQRTSAFLSVWLNECVILEYFVLNCLYCSWIGIIANKPYVLHNYQLMIVIVSIVFVFVQ